RSRARSSSKGVTMATTTSPNRAITLAPPSSVPLRDPTRSPRAAPLRSAASRSCLLGPLEPEGGEQVLVQFEPDRMVRVDGRLGEPVAVALGHPLEGRAQPG